MQILQSPPESPRSCHLQSHPKALSRQNWPLIAGVSVGLIVFVVIPMLLQSSAVTPFDITYRVFPMDLHATLRLVSRHLSPGDYDVAAQSHARSESQPHFQLQSPQSAASSDASRHPIEPKAHHLPFPRKLGLIAISAGERAKPVVEKIIEKFGFEHFSFMLFHWDDSSWAHYDWYNKVAAVRAVNQTKYWFAKRFLVPDMTRNYDYIFLWDDDVLPEDHFDAIALITVLKEFNIHVAQPTVSIAWHGLQSEVTRHHSGIKYGRWTNFIEMMVPIFSSKAWEACAWRIINYSARAAWGIDNAWYPICSSVGFCRFATLDAFPVRHLDTRTFATDISRNLKELWSYLDFYRVKCKFRSKFAALSGIQTPSAIRKLIFDPQMTHFVDRICNYWETKKEMALFHTLGEIELEDMYSDRCPEGLEPNGYDRESLWEGVIPVDVRV